MAITKVWIEEGCTACGLCEDICPDIFKVQDGTTVVIDDKYYAHEEGIREAAENCPVEVIQFTERRDD